MQCCVFVAKIADIFVYVRTKFVLSRWSSGYYPRLRSCGLGSIPGTDRTLFARAKQRNGSTLECGLTNTSEAFRYWVLQYHSVLLMLILAKAI